MQLTAHQRERLETDIDRLIQEQSFKGIEWGGGEFMLSGDHGRRATFVAELLDTIERALEPTVNPFCRSVRIRQIDPTVTFNGGE